MWLEVKMMKKITIALFLLIMLSMGVLAANCVQNADCLAGEVCSSGLCVVPGCQVNTDCDWEAGEVCSSGQCIIPECLTDVDCAAGKVCDFNKCVIVPQCVVNADCGAGGTCLFGQCTIQVISDEVTQEESGCKVDANCLIGWTCVSGQCVMQQGSPQDQVICQQVVNASVEDKVLVGGVLDALENPNQLDAILDIFAALNNWLNP